MVFISPKAVDSQNVRNEINFAQKCEKQFLQVDVEETKLPRGLDFQMSSIQAVHKYKMSEESYHRKIQRVLSNELKTKSQDVNTNETMILENTKQRKINYNEEGLLNKLCAITCEEQLPPLEIKNSIGMKLVVIPDGEFVMGSDASNETRPVHNVKISKPFYLGKYPVTQREWIAVMGSNPSRRFLGDDYPVQDISWDDAQDFINKINKKESTAKYRLPSEAEWEYACRAGTTSQYFFGDTKSNYEQYANYIHFPAKGGRFRPNVNQKKPNQWNLYDMYGWIFQLCQDKWHDSYNGAPTDGTAWEDGENLRVLRGGSLPFVPYNSAPRTFLLRGRPFGCDGSVFPFCGIGFRLVKEM